MQRTEKMEVKEIFKIIKVEMFSYSGTRYSVYFSLNSFKKRMGSILIKFIPNIGKGCR